MEKLKLNIQKFASGILSLGVSGALEGRIVWNSTSNGSSANTSNVFGDLQIRRTNSATTTGTFTYGFRVNNKVVHTSWYGSISSNWVSISTLSDVVAHYNDGIGYCYLEAYVNGPSGTSLSGLTVTAKDSVLLDKIARFATVTEVSNFTDEENPIINFTNPAGFDIRLRISVGTDTELIVRDKVTKVGPYTFELTESERNLLRAKTPNNNELTVKMVVDTYIDGTIQNNSFVERKMTIVNANPTFSNFDFEDINATTLALTGNAKYNINGYSTIKAKISTTNKATAKKSATMSKYRFAIGDLSKDINYSSTAEVSGSIEKAPVGTYNLYAIDSRNNSTLVTKLAQKVIEYSPLYIDRQNTYVSRDDGGVGGDVALTFSGYIWNNSFGAKNNSIKSASYRFKKTTSSEWITGTTNITPTISGNKFSFSALVRSNNADYTFDLSSSYDFEITIADQLSSDTFKLTPLGSAIPNLALADTGVGIMGAYDESVGGLLQVGGQRIDYNTGIYSEEEQLIGTYLGKPLYRKCFKLGRIGDTSANKTHTLSGNYKEAIKCDALMTYSTGVTVSLPLYISDGLFGFCNASCQGDGKMDINLYRNSASSWYEFELVAIVEYTKTTD